MAYGNNYHLEINVKLQALQLMIIVIFNRGDHKVSVAKSKFFLSLPVALRDALKYPYQYTKGVN